MPAQEHNVHGREIVKDKARGIAELERETCSRQWCLVLDHLNRVPLTCFSCGFTQAHRYTSGTDSGGKTPFWTCNWLHLTSSRVTVRSISKGFLLRSPAPPKLSTLHGKHRHGPER